MHVSAPVTSKAAHKAHRYASAMADQDKLSEFANAISPR
jgi:hypothetical protein